MLVSHSSDVGVLQQDGSTALTIINTIAIKNITSNILVAKLHEQRHKGEAGLWRDMISM